MLLAKIKATVLCMAMCIMLSVHHVPEFLSTSHAFKHGFPEITFPEPDPFYIFYIRATILKGDIAFIYEAFYSFYFHIASVAFFLRYLYSY